ncbi:hypothetical protein FPV67DRAFT_1479937 [Lyophyllum atratum]|nr:hypothetical protein FPV67DRAFT_1479937 [Lyophyllum atratum]
MAPVKNQPSPDQFTTNDPTSNPQWHQAGTPVIMPSEVVPPTRTDSIPQQGATQPGGGSELHSGQQGPNVVQIPCEPAKVPFKEQVIGVARKTRGTVLGKPELKQEGEMILEGKKTHNEPKPE